MVNYYRNKAKYPADQIWKFISDLNDGTGSDLSLKDINKFTCWNPEEEIDHRMTKWMVYDLLIQRGHKLLVEKRLGGGIFDILDCTSQEVYEIETKKSEKTYQKKLRQFNHFLIKDLKIIYIQDLSENWEERYKKLQELL